jgi:hypothetical protein
MSSSPELQALREQVATLTEKLEHLQQYQSVLDEIQAVKLDIQEKWLTFKVASLVGTALLAILGAVGYGSWRDLTSRIDRQMTETVEKSKVFYDDLMSGAALMVQKNHAAAMPRLLNCFKNGHEYDKAVLLPLLISLNLTDDWENASPVVAKLRADSSRFDNINDAPVYAVAGAILVQGGISKSNSGSTALTQLNMDEGLALLNRTLPLVAPNDFATRKQVLTNLWLYYIARGQFAKAKDYADSISTLPPDVFVYGWANMRTWRCMRDLSVAHKDYLDKAEQQWKALGERAKLTT